MLINLIILIIQHAKFRCEYCKTALFIKQGAYDAHLDVSDTVGNDDR